MISLPRFVAAFLFFPILVAGCSSSSKSGSMISGKVSYKGQPIPQGTISFHRTAEDQSGVYSYPIIDGKYEGAGLVAEDMIVTVETESANPKRTTPQYTKAGVKEDSTAKYDKMMREKGFKAGLATDPSRYVKIPKKYEDKKSSNLRATITRGKNTKDFDLTDE